MFLNTHYEKNTYEFQYLDLTVTDQFHQETEKKDKIFQFDKETVIIQKKWEQVVYYFIISTYLEYLRLLINLIYNAPILKGKKFYPEIFYPRKLIIRRENPLRAEKH